MPILSKKLMAGAKKVAAEKRVKDRTRAGSGITEHEMVEYYRGDMPPSKPKAAIGPKYKRK